MAEPIPQDFKNFTGVGAFAMNLAEMLGTLLQRHGYSDKAPESLEELLAAGNKAVAQPISNTTGVNPVTNGWLATLSSSYHVMKRAGHAHDAGKLNEMLHYLARGDRQPVQFPPEVTNALETVTRALDDLAAGGSFNDVVERTGVTAQVGAARVSAEAAIKAAAEAAEKVPVVLVEMNGSAISLVTATGPAHVVFLDEDTESGDPDNVMPIGNEELYVTDMSAECDRDAVVRIHDILDQIYENRQAFAEQVLAQGDEMTFDAEGSSPRG